MLRCSRVGWLSSSFPSPGTRPPKDFLKRGERPSKYALKTSGIARSISENCAKHFAIADDDDAGNSHPMSSSSQEPQRQRPSSSDPHSFAPPRLSKEAARKALMQQRIAELESRADSILEVSEGGEEDIDLGGMPAEHYHDRADSVVIPSQSALHQSVLDRAGLGSRERNNTWTTTARRQLPLEVERELRDRAGDTAWAAQDAEYSRDFDDPSLAPAEEQIQHTQSIYTQRKLYIDGLVGYTRIITRDEELRISAELMQLLQRPTAKYIPQEHRYCVNLFEHSVGLHNRDPLAFSLAEDAPVLHAVLTRFFELELIPAPPNVVQVSEMVGDNAGYPPHVKHPSIGSYFGLLNLVSQDTLYMSHTAAPWFPRLLLQPRHLYVVSAPAVRDYSFGYKKTHRTLHEFRDGLRTTKDYRLEVLFATVDAKSVPALGDAVCMTEYHHQQRKYRVAASTAGVAGPHGVAAKGNGGSGGGGGDAPSSPQSVDDIIKKLQQVSAKAQVLTSANAGTVADKKTAVTKPPSAEDAKRMLRVIDCDFRQKP